MSISEPKKEYPLNKENVKAYISKVSTCSRETEALEKFFEVTKYISFDELIFALKQVILKFKITGEYAACLFSIDWIPVDNKSNYWIYRLMIKLGLPPPVMEIRDEDDLQVAVSRGITRFVFFDDASFSGYQVYDTIYSTFLMQMLKLNYLDISVDLLLGYASPRALKIFNHLVPEDLPTVPLDELTQIHDLQTIMATNQRFKGHITLNIIYYEQMRSLKELVDEKTLKTLEGLGISDRKIPIYFVHKMPDYISSYSEIYMGFTLKEPYEIIPLITNSEEYYNNFLLREVENRDDIEDLSRDAPCPPSPYK